MRLSGWAGMILLSPDSGLPGQLEPERRAAAAALGEADASAHHLHQPLADRQAEAGAALLARVGHVGLREAAEDAAAEALRDAGPRIVDFDAHAVARVFHADLE